MAPLTPPQPTTYNASLSAFSLFCLPSMFLTLEGDDR